MGTLNAVQYLNSYFHSQFPCEDEPNIGTGSSSDAPSKGSVAVLDLIRHRGVVGLISLLCLPQVCVCMYVHCCFWLA